MLLVTGKGGVGKTTVAASLAVMDAELRGFAALVEFGDGQSGKRALAGTGGLVEHIVVRPEEALRRGATPLFGSATLARLALGNFAMKPLVRAAPAVRELAMLESVRQLAAGIQQDQAFDRLPILADALEDANCTDRPLLDHLRHGTNHRRGCWGFDLVMGRA